MRGGGLRTSELLVRAVHEERRRSDESTALDSRRVAVAPAVRALGVEHLVRRRGDLLQCAMLTTLPVRAGDHFSQHEFDVLVRALDHTVALHQDVMARTDLLTLLSVGRLPGGGGAGDADTYSLRPVQPPTAATYARLVRPFLLGHLRLDGDDGDTSITRSMLQVIRNDPDLILFSEIEGECDAERAAESELISLMHEFLFSVASVCVSRGSEEVIRSMYFEVRDPPAAAAQPPASAADGADSGSEGDEEEDEGALVLFPGARRQGNDADREIRLCGLGAARALLSALKHVLLGALNAAVMWAAEEQSSQAPGVRLLEDLGAGASAVHLLRFVCLSIAKVRREDSSTMTAKRDLVVSVGDDGKYVYTFAGVVWTYAHLGEVIQFSADQLESALTAVVGCEMAEQILYDADLQRQTRFAFAGATARGMSSRPPQRTGPGFREVRESMLRFVREQGPAAAAAAVRAVGGAVLSVVHLAAVASHRSRCRGAALVVPGRRRRRHALQQERLRRARGAHTRGFRRRAAGHGRARAPAGPALVEERSSRAGHRAQLPERRVLRSAGAEGGAGGGGARWRRRRAAEGPARVEPARVAAVQARWRCGLPAHLRRHGQGGRGALLQRGSPGGARGQASGQPSAPAGAVPRRAQVQRGRQHRGQQRTSREDLVCGGGGGALRRGPNRRHAGGANGAEQGR